MKVALKITEVKRVGPLFFPKETQDMRGFSK
jgi:hypothetical protein